VFSQYSLPHLPFVRLFVSHSYFQYGYGFGAWWGTVLVALAGLCTCCSASCKGGIIAAAIFATAGFATALIGAIWDSSAAMYFGRFQACMVLPKGNDDLVMVYWGNPDYYSDLQKCMGRGTDDNLWIPSLIGPSGGKNGVCVCIMTGATKCAQFTLSDSTLKSKLNCGNILDTYTNTLRSSAAFCTLSGLSACLLAGLTCFMICCNYERDIGETEFEKRLEFGPSSSNSTSSVINRTGMQEI
jgi:hypothetical protein